MNAAEHYQRMTDTLRKHYPDAKLFQRDGLEHPIVVYPPQAEQMTQPDSALGRLREAVIQPEALPIYDHALLQTLQNSGRQLYNGVTFAFHHLDAKPLRIHGQYGRYFDYLASCTALEREVRDAVSDKRVRLPLRRQLHQTVSPQRALTHGDGRSAALGVLVLIVAKVGGRYHALMAKRSGRSATYAHFYDILPTFIFQPLGERLRDPMEWTLRYHIEREYLEELFALEEDTHPERLDYFHAHPAWRDLRAMQNDGRAALYLTGASMNLLNLKPELYALLLIHDADWLPRVRREGSATPLDISAETEGALILAPIDDDEALKAQLPAPLHVHMPVQAYAALWLGLDAARAFFN